MIKGYAVHGSRFIIFDFKIFFVIMYVKIEHKFYPVTPEPLLVWDLVCNFWLQIGKSIHASFTDKEVI